MNTKRKMEKLRQRPPPRPARSKLNGEFARTAEQVGESSSYSPAFRWELPPLPRAPNVKTRGQRVARCGNVARWRSARNKKSRSETISTWQRRLHADVRVVKHAARRKINGRRVDSPAQMSKLVRLFSYFFLFLFSSPFFPSFAGEFLVSQYSCRDTTSRWCARGLKWSETYAYTAFPPRCRSFAGVFSNDRRWPKGQTISVSTQSNNQPTELKYSIGKFSQLLFWIRSAGE